MTDMTTDPRVKMGLGERLAAAWATFKVTHKADPEAFNKWKAARDRSEAIALSKLDGFDRALIVTLVSATKADAEALLARLAPSIEKLEIKYQLWIAAHIARQNPTLILAPAMRKLNERVAPMVATTGQRGLSALNLAE